MDFPYIVSFGLSQGVYYASAFMTIGLILGAVIHVINIMT